jgi:negative regulator of sigma E activity
MRGYEVTDRLKESLSAWIDDEASEIEVHQLLREYKADEAVHEQWLGFQHVSAVASGKQQLSPQLSQQQHLTLHASISAAILQDEVVHGQGATVADIQPKGPAATWLRPAGGLALAASLVIAVFVGMQLQLDGVDAGAPVAISQQAAGKVSLTGPVAAQTVGTGVPTGVSSQSYPSQTYALDAMASGQAFPSQAATAGQEYETVDGQTELKALDATKQRQLRNYLRQHDQMARMNPNARTVFFESQGNQ